MFESLQRQSGASGQHRRVLCSVSLRLHHVEAVAGLRARCTLVFFRSIIILIANHRNVMIACTTDYVYDEEVISLSCKLLHSTCCVQNHDSLARLSLGYGLVREGNVGNGHQKLP